jgi:hypothetical protein
VNLEHRFDCDLREEIALDIPGQGLDTLSLQRQGYWGIRDRKPHTLKKPHPHIFLYKYSNIKPLTVYHPIFYRNLHALVYPETPVFITFINFQPHTII